MSRLKCVNIQFRPFTGLFLVLSLFFTDPLFASHENNMSEALSAYDGGDYQKAYEIWSHHAKAGNPTAMTTLANMYQNGEGRPASSADAWKWYQRAAERGDVTAQLNLGDMLAAPPRTHGNVERAYFWLGLASKGGNKWASRLQKKLGKTLKLQERALLDKEISEWSPLEKDTPVPD